MRKEQAGDHKDEKELVDGVHEFAGSLAA
jgi:hypothetical protein